MLSVSATLLKKPLLWVAGITSIVVPSCMMTLYYSDANKLNLWDSEESGRDYLQIPFDRLDAVRACELETAEKFGGEFVRSSVDWRSTRFQESRNQFVVVLNTDVGTLQYFESAIAYCYISPRTRTVSYFKAYDSKGEPMLSRAITSDDIFNALKSER